jgi:hypothetical protein
MTTVFNYWMLTEDKTRRDKAILIITDGWQFYQDNKNGEWWWADDYGWWGLFCLIVYKYIANRGPDGLPDGFQADMKQGAIDCYAQMTINLDNESGGIYNVMANKNNTESRRNTITNALYWAICSGLASINAGSNYADDANNWYNWLFYGKWKGNFPPRTWGLFNSQHVVLETALGAGQSNDHLPSWYWSGDQGTVLIALLYYRDLVTDPKMKTHLETIGRNLIAAAIKESGPFVDQVGILHESPSQDNYGEFATDYATGKGVFLRHLSTFAINVSGTSNVPAFLAKTADAAWNSRYKSTNGTARNWNEYGPDGEKGPVNFDQFWSRALQTGGLDALNSAILCPPVSDEQKAQHLNKD